MTDPYAISREQATRLAVELDLPIDILAESIWLRTVAGGGPPTDDEVRRHVEQTGRHVSGRADGAEQIRPAERYSHATGAYVLEHGRLRGRQKWELIRVGTGELAHRARTRIRVLRWIAEHLPGGCWTRSITTRERAEILRRWR